MNLVPLAEGDEPGWSAEQCRTSPRPLGMEDLVIAGVELDDSQARVALYGVPDRPGYAARVFRAIAAAGVFVDMIVQNVGQDGNSLLSFTVPQGAAARAAEAVNRRGHCAGFGRACAGEAFGRRRRHAHAHRRRYSHVCSPGRTWHQHQLDQHQ